MTSFIKGQTSSNKKIHSPSQQAYYSTTQTNFFKAYAHQIQFVKRLSELLNSIEKRKVLKVIDDVKSGNKVFRKFLNERRIVFIKIQDVINFQQMCQKQLFGNTSTSFSFNMQNSNDSKKNYLPLIRESEIGNKQCRLSNFNMTSKSYLSQQGKSKSMSLQSKQMIKKGFMTFLQKLQNLKKQQFINQTKYLQSILIRQSNKLKTYCVNQDNSETNKKKQRSYKLSIVQQIQKQQKINGLYPIIMKNVRQETLAIERVQGLYELLMEN